MIQSFKQKPQLNDSYDVILIGSGMGSLTAGALLAKEGKSVLMLERHYVAGGFTHVFKRKGFEWDVGIHYIGDMGRKNSVLKRLFDYITNNQLTWADMGPVYDRIIIGDKKYDFVKGVSNFIEQLSQYFPAESANIQKYISIVFDCGKTAANFYTDKILPSYISNTAGVFWRNKFHKYSDQTTYDVLRSITDNEDLIKVLTGQYGDYGLPPKQSSFAMHASVVRHYLKGGYFPIGGSSKIVEHIDPVISKQRGTILISAEVESILCENNKALGVRMRNGQEIKAPTIISGAGIVNTYQHLLPEKVQEANNLKSHLTQVQPSVSHACLYIGLNQSPEALSLPKTNLWIYPEDLDHDGCVERYLEDTNQPFPVVYISFPSAKDPDWTNRYPGKSTIDIITLIPWKTFAAWDGSRWMKRGDAYESKKEAISQRLLNILYHHLPQTRKAIEHYELSTPLTTKHFVNYRKGEIYGLDHSPKRFRQKFLKPKTPIKNLYLTGQDIVTAGIGGALFSGLLTASEVIGKNLLKKVMQ